MSSAFALALLVPLGLFAALPTAMAQQAWPAKPLRLVVGFAPGGNVDITARTLSPVLSEQLGQPILVENRAGAGGNVGAEVVARSAPDGYTLLLGASSLAVNVSLYASLPFDPLKDLVAVAPVSNVPLVLTVNPRVPAKDAKEYVALARTRKGIITYASAGTGTSNHLTGELFRSVAKIELIHVPYKGSGAALGDLVGGQVDSMFDQLSSSLPFIRAGKVRVLGVTSAKRSGVLPEVPTLAEQGFAGIDSSTWLGVFVQSATPRELVQRLNASLQKVARNPAFRERLATLGADALESSPEQFAQFFRDEVALWARIVKSSGAKAE
ncbi:MAG: tripartite tricarboxylate transporter substrate binding protein [Pseudomonadota bacterium]